MKRVHVPRALVIVITAEARGQCGYCQTQIKYVGPVMVMEHIIPIAAGGKTDKDNLWLACHPCNSRKGKKTEAIDPESGQVAPLFNPRTQHWSDHFTWSDDGVIIIDQTPTGRATVVALKLNDEEVVKPRRRWVEMGWHPPRD